MADAKNIENIYKLTPLQEGMLFHNMLNDTQTEYVIQTVLKSTKIDVEILREALDLLSIKHEVLRTMFVEHKVKTPVQIILKNRSVEVNNIDLTDVQNKNDSFEQIKKSDIGRGFDLEKDSLLRVTVVKFADNDYRLLWSVHHIIVDGWSNSVVFSDFIYIYEYLSKGNNKNALKESILKEKSVKNKYADYVKLITQKNRSSGLKYWNDLLAGYEDTANFRPYINKAEEKKVVAEYEIAFDVSESNKIIEYSKKHSLTVSSIVEMAYGILLQRYNHCNDVVFGKVVSGRNYDLEGIESMVGLFINTIPVRVTTNPDMTISQYAEYMMKQSLESGKYDFCGLSEIQANTSVSMGFIKVLYIFENYYVDEKGLSRIKDTDFVFESAREETNYDMNLFAYLDDALHLKLMFNKSIYENNYAENVLNQLMHVIKEIVDDSNKKVDDIEILTDNEKNLILNDFNNTFAEYPKEKNIVELFEEQVSKTPDKAAFVFENKKLTYCELNKKSNIIANKLRKAGVGRGDFVALITERSMETVIGIYGILKSGAAYVPVDPEYPDSRIEYMLEDSKAKVAIVYNAEINPNIDVINMNNSDIWDDADDTPECLNGPDDVAYLIYTSGTTGKPKGVMVKHSNVVNYSMEHKYSVMQPAYENLYDKMVAVTNVTFDIHVTEIIASILSGFTVYLANRTEQENTEAFETLVVDNEIQILQITPSRMKLYLLDEKHNDYLKQLKFIMLGGEKVGGDVVRKIRQFSDAILENVYGPSETTVWSTAYIIDNDNYNEDISVGKPISNTQVYIVDNGKLCGIGVIGELCISGDGVSKGYLNREELTREKFEKNPYGNGLLYHTGDLARWLPDGNLDCLGRIDDQIKIRGHRIELGEIETMIKSQQNVKDAVVITRKDQYGELGINAYLVSDIQLDINEIRDNIGSSLPSYMIPQYMMQIEAIPTTANGKLDRRALPEITVGVEREIIAPQNDIQEHICKIYTEILGISQVGINSNFFELGGHSLRATRMINKIEEELGVRIALKEVFKDSTPLHLSKLVETELKIGELYEAIPVAEEKQYYNMSSVQKRTYLLWSMDKSQIAYNMPIALRLTGNVNTKDIKTALQKLKNRHEILRTKFYTLDSEFVQQIIEADKTDFDFIEYEDYEKEDKELVKDFIKPFDLENAELIRAGLIKRQYGYLLIIDMHHIVSDGMSSGIFIKEFSAIYNNEHIEEIRQYKDYSEWINQKDLTKQKEYWVNQFDEVPVLEMPLDYRRGTEQSFNGSAVYRNINSKLTADIKTIAQNNGATEYMVMLSAAMIVLGKYSRQEDIVIGSPISGRTHKDTEGMLGMFINTLAMRGKPENSKQYKAFLNEIKETCLKAYENQEYPFEELIEAVNVRRDFARNPLFDVMFVLQNNEQQGITLNDVNAQVVLQDHNIAKVDITFFAYENAGEYQMALEYCSDLFKEDSAKKILEHFEEVLKQITRQPDIKIGEIETATDEEKKLILNEFNNTDIDYDRSKCVAELFEEQVSRTPNQIALVFEEEQLTYKELNEKANILANKLRENGIKPNDYVALLTERSKETVIGIYAILKAGAAYVPIDPEYPEDRIRYILEDCNPKAILLYKAEVDSKINTINLADSDVWEGKTKNPEIVNNPDDIAYVIYTSGTTGKPKGVMVKQSNVVNFVTGHAKGSMYAAEEKGHKKIVAVTNITFDIHVTEIIYSLTNGMTVYFANRNEQEQTAAFEKLVISNEIEMLQTTPSRIKLYMLEKERTEYLKQLKYIMLAGEKLSGSLIRQIRKESEAVLVNGYGPSETTVYASVEVIREKEVGEDISIGRPINNTQIYIMNEDKLCGIGVVGELCIAGEGVSKGYLNQEELTNEKYAKNPYGEGLIYHSGDLARWLPDGRIDCLGRIDEQVKVRGYRIELGEIDAVIRQENGILDCAVITRNDSEGEKAIYAYLVSYDEIDLSVIRNNISERLPYYMVPAYMMQIDSIPTTKNGKLDKRALPEITAITKSEFSDAMNDTEKAICQIFEEILDIERVGADDNFFELGGHSIKATRIINEIEKNLGKRITLSDMFALGTPRQIAKTIDIQKTDNEEYEPIPKAEEKPYYEMSSTQKRMYLLYLANKETLAYNTFIALELPQDSEIDKIEYALDRLINRHEILHTVFYENQGELVQEILQDYEFELEKEEVNTIPADLTINFVRPFCLENELPIRARIIYSSTRKILLLDIHHIVQDGETLYILLNEFNRIYNGWNPEPRRLQYKDYSEWMRKKDISNQKEYWLKVFDEKVNSLELATDFPRPTVKSFEGSTCIYKLDEQLFSKVEQLASNTGTTAYMILLSAWMILLSKYSQQEDIVVGTPMLGRNHKDLDDMLGMFVNTVAMRGKPCADKTFEVFLQEMKTICIEAVENQEYPFEMLVEDLRIARDTSRNPLFDVMFIFQNQWSDHNSKYDTPAELKAQKKNGSKFDLTFEIQQVNNSYIANLEYSTDLYSEESAILIVKNFEKILLECCDNVNREIKGINMVSNDIVNKGKRMCNESLVQQDTNVSENNSKKEVLNAVEQEILDIMKGILKHDNIHVTESFFEAGGNSLLGIRLVSALKKKGYNIKIGDLFKYESAEQLAQIVNKSDDINALNIPIAEDKKYYIMSSNQKRIYSLWKKNKEGTAYNMPVTTRVIGEINSEKLNKALYAMIQRHEILRTKFISVDGEFVQEILPIDEIKTDVEVIEELYSDEKSIINKLIRPFNLEKGELIRVSLVKRKEGYLLFFDMHHIISDGMSAGIFFNEFATVYNGDEPTNMARQYKDYSEWMLNRDLSSQKEYWVKQFEEEAPIINLPLDYRRTNEQINNGAEYTIKSGHELADNIKNLAKKYGVTEYMIFLSTAMILLSKYSRQDDIVIGSPVSGRIHKDTESMLGMFVNTLAMRGKPNKNKIYSEFLNEIKAVCTNAYENQEYPFEELVEAIGVKRDATRNPLFDVMLILQNNEKTQVEFKNTKFEPAELVDIDSKFDLTFNIWDYNDEYHIILEYNCELFKEETIKRMLEHYLLILNQIASVDDIHIKDIEMVTQEEKKAIIDVFNNTSAPYPKDKTIVELFEEQVMKTPNEIAAVYGGKQLTYMELNKKANVLANKLRALGVCKNDFVAIMTRRGLEMIQAVYGILKAGAAYIAIEPEYPEDRIRYMMADCDPKVALIYNCDSSLLATDIPVINLADEETWIGHTENPERINESTDLAYAIYTSGTTGRPKGIMVKHCNVLNYICDTEYGILKDAMSRGYKRIVGLANLSFDIHVTELLLTTINGMSVYIASKKELENTEAFEQLSVTNDLEILQTTPSRMKLYLLDERHLEFMKHYKYIMLGGEKVQKTLLDKIRKYSDAVIANVYGPSETTVWASIGAIDKEVNEEDITVGKPVSNVKFYVMDDMQLCGIGVPGELCIAGDGVTGGYLNLPELTAEKFIKNPFGKGYMYRSGDLVRWTKEGDIQYLDRIDQQVKVRGYRIELGEISSVILEENEIKDCAVITKENKLGENEIYAYLVSDNTLDLKELKMKIGKKLTSYMIPAYMMQIDSIPTNKNGKLDKRALPEIEENSIDDYVAPSNEIEEVICTIFGEILAVENVSVNDDFFELGGHSISVVKLEMALQSQGFNIQMAQIFESPTPRELALLAKENS